MGGHVRAVFTLVTFIFIFCVAITVTSFREIPLWRLEASAPRAPDFLSDDNNDNDVKNIPAAELTESNEVLNEKLTKTTSYGALDNDQLVVPSTSVKTN